MEEVQIALNFFIPNLFCFYQSTQQKNRIWLFSVWSTHRPTKHNSQNLSFYSVKLKLTFIFSMELHFIQNSLWTVWNLNFFFGVALRLQKINKWGGKAVILPQLSWCVNLLQWSKDSHVHCVKKNQNEVNRLKCTSVIHHKTRSARVTFSPLSFP